VWECSVKGARKNPAEVTAQMESWLKGDNIFMEISG